MTREISPIAVRPWTLNGISERMIVSHYENNYSGVVRTLNGVRRELALIEPGAPPTRLRTLKREGMTILLVEHDMDFVMGLTDRLVVMDFGEKLAEGLPVEIQENPLVRVGVDLVLDGDLLGDFEVFPHGALVDRERQALVAAGIDFATAEAAWADVAEATRSVYEELA